MSVSDSHPAISALAYPYPLWRYLLLFQSGSQLASWLFCVLASAWLMHALLRGMGEAPPAEALLGGMALGSLVSVCMVLPARFCVAPAEAGSMRILLDTLAFLGYVHEQRLGTSDVYRQKLPRVLRWEEGEVRIARLGGEIVVSGPRSIVGAMRKAVVKAARSDCAGNIAS